MFAIKDWVVVTQELETVTPGGIIIPDKVQKKNRPSRGVIAHAGKDCTEVQVGDTILFSLENCFTETVGENTIVCMKESNVIMVLERVSE